MGLCTLPYPVCTSVLMTMADLLEHHLSLLSHLARGNQVFLTHPYLSLLQNILTPLFSCWAEVFVPQLQPLGSWGLGASMPSIPGGLHLASHLPSLKFRLKSWKTTFPCCSGGELSYSGLLVVRVSGKNVCMDGWASKTSKHNPVNNSMKTYSWRLFWGTFC